MGDLEERSSLPDSREEMMGHRRRPRHHRPQHGTAMSNSMIRRYTSAPSLQALDSRAGLQSLLFPDEFSMAASDDEVLEAMVEDQRTVVDRYSLESSIPQPRPPLSPLGRPEHSPASSPAVIRRDRRKKRMAPPPPTITAGRGGSPSPNASQRPLSDTVRLSVTNTSIDSAGSDVTDHSPLGETRSLGDSTGHSEPDLLRIGDSSPKDMSRLERIKFALKSPRNLRKNSKKWKDEPARWREDPDTWFRSKKNGVTLPRSSPW